MSVFPIKADPSDTARVRVSDAFAEHAWRSNVEIADYLPAAWREYLGRPGTLPGGAGMMAISPSNPYPHPIGDRLQDAYPADGGPPGSSPETMAMQLLDRHSVSKAVLGHTQAARMLPGHLNHHFGREMVRACNDWTLEQWLSGQDERLLGLILVQNQLPDAAAAEIGRVGDHPKMVGVLMGANGLGKPYGHPIYDPIHRAAAEHGLPIVIAAGTGLPIDVVTESTAGGPVATYAELHMLAHQALATHVVSLVVQGVFVRYPELKVLVVGGGVTWVLSILWRLDNEYRSFRREVPWLKRQPGDFLVDHVRISTWPLEGFRSRGSWERVFAALPDLERMVCYSSGYPAWDFNDPAMVAAALPPELHAAALERNSRELYRWPADEATRAAQTTASTHSGRETARLRKDGDGVLRAHHRQ